MNVNKKRENKKKRAKTAVTENSSDSYATDDQINDEDYQPTDENDISGDESAKQKENTQSSIAQVIRTGSSADESTAGTSGRMKSADSDKFLEICLTEFQFIRNMSTGNASNYQQRINENDSSWLRIQSKFYEYFKVSSYILIGIQTCLVSSMLSTID